MRKGLFHRFLFVLKHDEELDCCPRFNHRYKNILTVCLSVCLPACLSASLSANTVIVLLGFVLY